MIGLMGIELKVTLDDLVRGSLNGEVPDRAQALAVLLQLGR